MKNSKQIIFTLLFTLVALFTFCNVSEAVCIHTYTAATCVKPKICTKCKTTLGSALGHNYVVCGDTATCTRCSTTKKVNNTNTDSNTHVHTYTVATCTETKKCTSCGVISGRALGHEFTTITEAATCTTVGKKLQRCTRCGFEQGNSVILATGHSYDTKTIAATCTETGKTVQTCAKCGDTKSTTIATLGHNLKVITTNATCTTPGKTEKKCTRCNYTTTTTASILGHEYKETSNIAPTCTEVGKVIKTCTRCGDKQETVKSALGHKSSIVYNEDYHWNECDVCTTLTSAKEEHIFNSNNICKVCGYEKNVTPDKPGDEDESDDFEDEKSDELIIEPWMKENDKLDCLAVSLRSEPYIEDRANKNIYALNEKIIYYVDYKNGGKDIKDKVTLQLTLPLKFSVSKSNGASVSRNDKTFTWTFDGLDRDEAGTKVIIIEYTSLGNSKLTYKKITPKATISVKSKEKDVSAVLNLVVKDFDVEINDEHEPYMYGDKDTGYFRPDAIIKRGEGALVFTRIFGISTKFDQNTYAFPDLNETYLEARRAVMAATAYGIIEGYPDGMYRPNKAMTRGEFITILARQVEEEYGEGFEIKDESQLIKVYKDKNRIYYISDNEYYNAHWSISYATLLARLNMTPLTENERNLRVDDPITRAEVAQLVNFYLLRAPAEVSSSTKTKFPDVSKRHELFADIVEATRPAHNYSVTEDGTEEKE